MGLTGIVSDEEEGVWKVEVRKSCMAEFLGKIILGQKERKRERNGRN